jgi:filamentous hemagglutinin family protein
MFANELTLTSRGRRRAARISLKPLVLAMTLAGVMGAAQAGQTIPGEKDLPTGMTLQAGKAEITSNNPDTGVMVVNQASDKAVWTATDFSVGAKASFSNIGPSAKSDTLIRVTGGTPSQIYGTVFANNRLWLVNRSGIYVGAGASISAASLLMSARDVDPKEVESNYANFMAGKRVAFLAGAGNNDFGGGLIDISPGATIVTDGGLVMIAPNYIHNEGTLFTRNASEITLLAGNSAEVEIGDSGYITMAPLRSDVTDANFNPGRAIYNGDKGDIHTNDGDIKLIVAGAGPRGVTIGGAVGAASANGGGTLVNGVLNTGVVSAQTFNGKGSVLMQVKGQNGRVENKGTVIVNGLEGNGIAGTINLVAPEIQIGSDNVSSPALLQADGAMGGGQINLVATGSTANLINVSANSVISANVRDRGPAGSIRVLGSPNVNDDTQTSLAPKAPTGSGVVWLQGSFRAQGGSNGGDGGQIIISGSLVNSRLTNETGSTSAQYWVDARNNIGKAGTWKLYAPQVLIGPAASLNVDKLSSLVFDDDLSTLLGTGANVKIATYADAATPQPFVKFLDGTHIHSDSAPGNGNVQELAIESVDSVYLGRLANGAGADILIEATKAPMNVKLTADADNNGVGDLALVGAQRLIQQSAPGRAYAQIANTAAPVKIKSLGGNITLTGRSKADNPLATDDPVVLDNVTLDAQQGNVNISGTGGAGVNGDATTYFNGVAMGATDITARNMTITGGSLGATGVKMVGVNLSTVTNGKINIHGYSLGGVNDLTHLGVDAQDVSVDLGHAGELQMSGLAVGGTASDAVGLRVGFMNVRTSDEVVDGAVPRVTLVGQSDQSSAPGLQVQYGLNLGRTEGAKSNADVVIGAKANPNQAENALDLGLGRDSETGADIIKANFQSSGHINVRPMRVSQAGELSEDTGTAIHIGTRPFDTSFPTNFVVPRALFNGRMGDKLNVIVGSSLHSGRITTDDQVFLDPLATATLQNQGAESGGIVIGAQGGNPLILPSQAGRVQAQAVDTSTTTSAGILNLVSGGNISQTGAIVAQAVNVVTTPQATVTLNNPGNQIGSMLISGGGTVAIPPGVTPSSTGSITVFDAGANQFRTINATSNTGEPVNPDPTPIPETTIDAIAPSISTVESSDALGELRTDVYVRGQFTRPQVCTPANTGGGVAVDLDADPLAQQWLQVRRSAQLSSCSSVRNDSNCSAF